MSIKDRTELTILLGNFQHKLREVSKNENSNIIDIIEKKANQIEDCLRDINENV